VIHYLSDSELCAFFQWYNAHSLEEPAFYCALILCTGLRRDEARRLRVKDCKTIPYGIIWVRNGKGGKDRDVEVLPEFNPHYERYVKMRRNQGYTFLFGGYKKNRFGKLMAEDRPPAQRTVQRWWNSTMEKAGIDLPDKRMGGIHLGRRTYASWVPHIPYRGEDGTHKMDIFSLAAQLGHATLNTTARYYHATPAGTRHRGRAPEWPKYVCPAPTPEGEPEEGGKEQDVR